MEVYIKERYADWRRNAVDKAVQDELAEMENSVQKIEDAFYKNLEFGTGGLRGIIGAGTNKMNLYTVARATQGLAHYINKKYKNAKREIAVSYDSRKYSYEFARTAAEVLAANDIQVWIYPELMPTPCLSFAVRRMKCVAGIMITASHNPAEYNGYKVYDEDGCQITTRVADEIFYEIDKLDMFHDIKKLEEVWGSRIQEMPEYVYDDYVQAIKGTSMLGKKEELPREYPIVYTPLNGTGLRPVLRVLEESGYQKVIVVEEQREPDGRFPTCPYPNPEVKEAMKLGIEYAGNHGADLVLATDPDCDRVGVAVYDEEVGYRILSGNETGILLLDYICDMRKKHKHMPDNPVFIKTIVTTKLAERIAESYGVKTINVLTGFKFIGEQIGCLEKEGKGEDYIFGFEESCGYLSGSYVRDKDAVNAVYLICEMYAYYKNRGISLPGKLEELYSRYGYHVNALYSYVFEGAAGGKKMEALMEYLRKEKKVFGTSEREERYDYKNGIDRLPKADVLKFVLDGDITVIIRPSGTEPKMKAYLSVGAETKELAQKKEEELRKEIEKIIK